MLEVQTVSEATFGYTCGICGATGGWRICREVEDEVSIWVCDDCMTDEEKEWAA